MRPTSGCGDSNGPARRGLSIMGTRFMYERGGAALNNRRFVSTANISQDYAAPFLWMLQMSMLGVWGRFRAQ